MTKAADTNEFSIILLLDESTARKVDTARSQLPESPVRRDPPHMTLLGGISSESYKSDEELLNAVGGLMAGPLDKGLSAAVDCVRTINSDKYGSSSVIELKVIGKVLETRKQLIQELISRGYRVDGWDTKSYHPHITISLSVPLPSGQDFAGLFRAGDTVKLRGFALLRTQSRGSDGRRLVRVVIASDADAERPVS